MELSRKADVNREIYILANAGTVGDIALQLHQELQARGYSLLFEDVLFAAMTDVQYYTSWAVLEVQRKDGENVFLDKDTPLEAYEWAIIEPVLRAHCDLIQANLMESSRSLGGEQFGLTVSEASQSYAEAKRNMQNEAFIEPPVALKTMSER